MTCPICKEQIKDEAKFCNKCGSKIPRCPTCGEVIVKKMQFCTNDGTKLPESVLSLFPDSSDNNDYIPESTYEYQDLNKKKKSNGAGYAIIISIAILFCLVLGGLAGYKYFADEYPWETIKNQKNKVSAGDESGYESNDDVAYSTTITGEEMEDDKNGSFSEIDENLNNNYYYDDEVENQNIRDYDSYETGEIEIPTDSLAYFIENCDSEYLSISNIQSFDTGMCRIARNSIYAHSGREFSDIALQEFFSRYDWYYSYFAH